MVQRELVQIPVFIFNNLQSKSCLLTEKVLDIHWGGGSPGNASHEEKMAL